MAEAASITFTISGHDRNMRRLLRDIDKGTSKVVVNLGRMGRASDSVDQKMTGWLGRAARGVTKFVAGIDLMRRAVAQLGREYEFMLSKQQLAMTLNLGIEQAKGLTGMMAHARQEEGFTKENYEKLVRRMGVSGKVTPQEAWSGMPAATSAAMRMGWESFADVAEQAGIIQKFTGVPWPTAHKGIAGTAIYTPYEGEQAAQYFMDFLSLSRMESMQHGAQRIPAILAAYQTYGIGSVKERMWFAPAATATLGALTGDVTGARTETGTNAMLRLMARQVPIAERMEKVKKTRPGMFPGSIETYEEEELVGELVPEIVFPSGRAPEWAQTGAAGLRYLGQRGYLDPRELGIGVAGGGGVSRIIAGAAMGAAGMFGGAGVTRRGTKPWIPTLTSLAGTREWIGQRISMMTDQELIWFAKRWGLGGRGVTRQAIQEFLGMGPIGDIEFETAKRRIQRRIAQFEGEQGMSLSEYLASWTDEKLLNLAGEAGVVQGQFAGSPEGRAKGLAGAAVSLLTAELDILGGPKTGSMTEAQITKMYDVLAIANAGRGLPPAERRGAMEAKIADITYSWSRKRATYFEPKVGGIGTGYGGGRITRPERWEATPDSQIMYDLYRRLNEPTGRDAREAPWATPGGGAAGPVSSAHPMVLPGAAGLAMHALGMSALAMGGGGEAATTAGAGAGAGGRLQAPQYQNDWTLLPIPNVTGALLAGRRGEVQRRLDARQARRERLWGVDPEEEARHGAAMAHIEMLRQRGISEFRREVEFAPDLGRSGEWMDQVGNALQHMNRVMQENKVNTINGQGWYEGASPLESTFA